MIKLIALILASLLQIIAAGGAIWLFRIARAKISWALIAIAFIIGAVRPVLELYTYLTSPELSHPNSDTWLALTTAFIMAVGIWIIGRMINTVNKSERIQRESETQFKTIFDNTSDEIYLAGLDGKLIEVNQEACETLGYNIEEFRKMRFHDLKTEKFLPTVDPNLAKIIEYGQYTYETEHVSRDGRVISLEVKSKIIEYKGEKAILSIARNITERKNLEHRILRAVIDAEEKERERTAKEIHDGLGPLLSTIKLYVNESLAGEATKKERLHLLAETNELIDEAINSVRTISNTITPRLIKDFGLIKAVDSLCKKINNTQQINITFKTSNLEGVLDDITELILYRIITELISNTIKHAKATLVEINLDYIDDQLILTYLDNGQGFDKNKVLNDETSGLGLKNIISRVESVDGTLRIHSAPGKGMLCSVSFTRTK